ncbi:MAG: hypothetical protein ACQCN5_03225 [Candidatus Bathyarchaeia archaeon]|jgi:magnesium-transporting ATPase (P-type)
MKHVAVYAVVALLLFFLSTAELAVANPIMTPMVDVESPVNNQVYPTSDVELKFTPLSWYTFSEYYYVLDDQTPTLINNTVTLTGLSAGSHTLRIFGNGTLTISSPPSHTYQSNDELVSVIYFSTYFSTAWVIFAAVIIFISVVISFVLYKKRVQIKAAFKGEKNGIFFVGLIMFTLSTLSFVFFAWHVLGNFLFPYWPPRAMTPNYNIPFVFSLFFLSLGLLIMWLSTIKRQPHPTPVQVNV